MHGTDRQMLEGRGRGRLEKENVARLAKEHIRIAPGHRQQCGEGRGCGGGGGEVSKERGKRGTSVRVSTIF